MNARASIRASRIVWSCLLFALAPGLALAEGDSSPNYADSGLYYEFGANLAMEAFHHDEGQEHKDAGGLNVRLGYRILPRLSTELQYEWVKGFRDENSPSDAKLSLWTLTLNGKAHLLTGRAQPYLLVGLGAVHASEEDGGYQLGDSNTDFGVRLGLGLDFYLNQNIALMTEGTYIIPTGDFEHLRYFSMTLGVLFRF